MRRERGFVLVNALVLIAALSAAAFVLLSRAGMSVTRQAVWQQSVQLSQMLEGVEVLAQARLNADLRGVEVDHASELWAEPITQATLDRGTVSGRIEDLQGRFNVNWLAVSEDEQAAEAFSRLLAGLGLSTEAGAALVAYVAPGGPGRVIRPDAPGLAERPAGGPILDLAQLDGVSGFSADTLARLAPHVAALPSDSRLNVNTATPEVLAAWLPDLDLAQARSLVAQRVRMPFPSVAGFLDALPATLEGGEGARLTVTSQWFLLNAEAQLEGRSRARRVVLNRVPLPQGTRVRYRLPDG